MVYGLLLKLSYQGSNCAWAKKQKNDMRTDILAFSPHLCYKLSLLHSIILTLAPRRVAVFLLSRWRQDNVWYLKQKETNSLMLAWKENVSMRCKLFFVGFFPCLWTLTWQSVPGDSVFNVRRVSSGVVLVCRVVNSFLQEMATTNRSRTDAQTTVGKKIKL